MKLFQYIVIAVVTVAVIAGFFIAGSPQEERLRKFDQQRVWDLQMIQSQIINYWQNKGELPDNLSLLNNDLLGFRVPVDPDTGAAYEYAPTGTLSFELCAVFARGSIGNDAAKGKYSTPQSQALGVADSWDYTEGRFCFQRTIDPDFFKLNPNLEKPLSVPVR